MKQCAYPKCSFEGTPSEVDDHLANIGTDPDHDGLPEYWSPVRNARGAAVLDLETTEDEVERRKAQMLSERMWSPSKTLGDPADCAEAEEIEASLDVVEDVPSVKVYRGEHVAWPSGE